MPVSVPLDQGALVSTDKLRGSCSFVKANPFSPDTALGQVQGRILPVRHSLFLKFSAYFAATPLYLMGVQLSTTCQPAWWLAAKPTNSLHFNSSKAGVNIFDVMLCAYSIKAAP